MPIPAAHCLQQLAKIAAAAVAAVASMQHADWTMAASITLQSACRLKLTYSRSNVVKHTLTQINTKAPASGYAIACYLPAMLAGIATSQLALADAADDFPLSASSSSGSRIRGGGTDLSTGHWLLRFHVAISVELSPQGRHKHKQVRSCLQIEVADTGRTRYDHCSQPAHSQMWQQLARLCKDGKPGTRKQRASS